MLSQSGHTGKVDSDDEPTVIENVTITPTSDPPDWTPEEERKAKLKVDLILLPILGLAFFALQMDRGNISNALTSTITTDLGIDTNQINVGNSLLSVGIVILEIPSNMIMQYIGPRRWLSGQIIAWGLVALLQNFITDYASYLVTRILLGLCEAGFIPGALYTMSTWYKRDESSLRVSIFFLGNLFASALTRLIGAAILTMGDRYGIAGWRWLFIIEGAMTIGIGIFFLLFLPARVGDGRPLITRLFGSKWSYFSPREDYILMRRVILDDPAKASNGGPMRITAHDVARTTRNPRILLHTIITLTATIPVNAINTYGPSVIQGLGYDAVKANALASVGAFVSIVMVIVLGWLCDLTGRSGPSALFAAVWSLISFACLREGTLNEWSKSRKYAAVVFSMSTNSTVHILNVGWLSANCRDPKARSIAMA